MEGCSRARASYAKYDGTNPWHQLDHRRAGAERVIDRRHLQPDDPAAQHFGMPPNSSAPVLSITRGSLCGINGKVTGSEPAAMTLHETRSSTTSRSTG